MSRFFSTRYLAVAVAAAAFFSVPAYGTVTTYSDAAAWQAAMGGAFSTQTFDTVPTGATTTSGGLVLTDLQVDGYLGTNHFLNNYLEVINESSASWWNWGGGGRILRGPQAQNGFQTGLVITFSATVTGFGLDLMVAGAPTSTLRVLADGNQISASDPTFPNGDVAVISANGTTANRAFFGIISTVPLTSFDIANLSSDMNTIPVLDSIRYGNASAQSETTEPGTLLLLGSGLVVLRFASRLRRRLVATAA